MSAPICVFHIRRGTQWSKTSCPQAIWGPSREQVTPFMFPCHPSHRHTSPRCTFLVGLSQGCAVLCLVTQSCLTLCDPMNCSPPGSSVHGDSPGKNTGVGCHALLQGIFPTQGSNPGLPHCRWILYHLGHQRSPRME